MTPEKPIKLVFDDIAISKSSDDSEIVISRRLSILEIAELLGVDVADVLEGKIGIFVLNELKEN